jgi:hypothetical protein
VRIAPVRAWVTSGLNESSDLPGRMDPTGTRWFTEQHCPGATCNPHKFVGPMATRLAECFYAIQREEAQRRAAYGVIFRVRPDHLFLRRIPPVGEALLPPDLPRGHVLLWDDQMALARREDAASVLLAPSLVYSTCADAEQWAHACRPFEGNAPNWTIDRCRADGYIPCPTMGLVTVFGAARGWRELPLRGRSYPQVNADDDFCLKRPCWMNSTCGRWRRREEGNMDC